MTITTDIKLLKNRRTKIVVTLGPASSTDTMIRGLIGSGVNVFRLNMSHGDLKQHKDTYDRLRSIVDEMDVSVAILADLCGPKIRTSKFQDGQINLVNGEMVTITTRAVVGRPGLIPSQYANLASDVKTGDQILINDGYLELIVDKVEDTEIFCTVVHGGVLKNHKGINLPGIKVSAPSLTEKDIQDAEFALNIGVDFLALSFVRNATDVDDLRKIVNKINPTVGIIAKIEKPEALENITAILDASDGIMVARGDLGIELKAEQIPVSQNQLIDAARAKLKPVIIATQMLESMITNVRPTRAEVTDISYAVTSGADAVMLSAESAIGAFPIEAVNMMDRICGILNPIFGREGLMVLDLKSPANFLFEKLSLMLLTLWHGI